MDETLFEEFKGEDVLHSAGCFSGSDSHEHDGVHDINCDTLECTKDPNVES